MFDVMKKSIFYLLLFLFLSQVLNSQNVVINEDFQVAQMLNRHIDANKSRTVMDGWRIQILSTSDRAKVEEMKSKFRATFPQYTVDWIHIKPNYKLRAGAFSTKLDAMEALNQIKKAFPSAYTAKVRDMNPREIVGW